MSDLLKEVSKVIENNLPSLQAELLVTHLKEAVADKAALERAQKDLNEVKKQNSIFAKQIMDQSQIKSLEEKANRTMEDAQKIIREHDINTLKIKLEESEKRANMVQDFVKILVSSPTTTISRYGNKPIMDEDGYCTTASFNEEVDVTHHKKRQ